MAPRLYKTRERPQAERLRRFCCLAVEISCEIGYTVL